MYKIEQYLNSRHGDYRDFKLTEKRSNEIYAHMKARALERTKEYENWIEAVQYLATGFIFESIGEILYFTALFDRNKEKILNVSTAQAMREAQKGDKYYKLRITETPNGKKASVQVFKEEFGIWLGEVLDRANYDRNK